MSNPETPAPNSQPTPPATDKQTTGAVDIQKLADKVYRLMREELRLERARGIQPVRRKER